MGHFPSNVHWDEQGETLYFDYNPESNPKDSLYKISLSESSSIVKVSPAEKRSMAPSSGNYNKDRSLKVFTRNGTLCLYDQQANKVTELLELNERISNPTFLNEEQVIAFEMAHNIYSYHLEKGLIKKLTNIQTGEQPGSKSNQASEKDQWLQKENKELLQVVRDREKTKELSKSYREATSEEEAYIFYTGKKNIHNINISPNGNYVTFNLYTPSKEQKRTFVPDYTHLSGYTTELNTRPKVGTSPSKVEMVIYHLQKDTAYVISTSELPGIKDLPDYTKDYPDKDWKKEEREVIPSGPYFSDDGQAIINVRSTDNKDRWIALLDVETGKLKSLDRQRDEAWIAGPGIGYSSGGGTMGWLPDNRHIYFQSEESGYSHLYLYDITSGTKKALTQGKFEVFEPQLSLDKKSWYLTSSETHPGERHFYKMPLMGGKMTKLTQMSGNNKVALSPDEKHLAILHSSSNAPWELYLKENSPESTPTKLTGGQSNDFKAYPWKAPEIVQFKAEDGEKVYARLYEPKKPNGAAVIFVHGAGYLQNAHKWWSSYFREYMFHNLLSDLGYTVLDIDYRGSAGYGRDWRTGIYRHMGGKDLSDQVDGAKYLIDSHDINPDKIGIYGGSYGGFITLMALFKEGDLFKSGAALRSVTDWAHYNHGYTSNILNEPVNDPLAYKRSSPIYFAEGFKGNLLIAHGMVDVNVHFQDVVRLSQRLIELGKDNWEMAVYPVEDHGFVEPSSWTDEYKRILKLFNDTLLD
ncbi:prolyl oligopeptidase family serine peptidase [Echinicola sediminis]